MTDEERIQKKQNRADGLNRLREIYKPPPQPTFICDIHGEQERNLQIFESRFCLRCFRIFLRNNNISEMEMTPTVLHTSVNLQSKQEVK